MKRFSSHLFASKKLSKEPYYWSLESLLIEYCLLSDVSWVLLIEYC